MKRNVGDVDRVIRITLGVIIIGMGVFYRSFLGLIGLIPLMTGIFGRCGLYVPFGINTCRLPEHQ